MVERIEGFAKDYECMLLWSGDDWYCVLQKIKIKDELIMELFDQCHLDKVFYDENSISYAVMH